MRKILFSFFFILFGKTVNRFYLFLIVHVFVCNSSFYGQKKYEDFAQKYTGMGAMSEIVMSHKCIVRNNFNLFYESSVNRNEIERTLVWYKLVFHQPCKVSFNIIPNNESDRYELEVYKSGVNFNVCTGDINSGFVLQDSISKTMTYTDSSQTASFRGSLFYTRDIEVGHDEVMYIIVNNLSGPDLGHVIDLQTCDYSYILKMNKESIDDQIKVNRDEFKTPFLRLKAIERKMCQSNDDKKLGYSSFLGDNMNIKNFSARALDSASKQQAKAIRLLDSLAGRQLAALPPPPVNAKSSYISISDDSLKNISSFINDSLSNSKLDTLLVHEKAATGIKNNISGGTDSVSVVAKSEDGKTIVVLDSVAAKYSNVVKADSIKKGINYRLPTVIISTEVPDWKTAQDFYSVQTSPSFSITDSLKGRASHEGRNYFLKDSLFNYFYEIKNPDPSVRGGENALKSNRRKRVSGGNWFIQFIALDAKTHRLLDHPDIKLFRGKSKRNYRIVFSDTLHGSRLEFQPASDLIVKAKVFGYLPYEEKFDTSYCYRFHDTLYDFLFLKPVQKGDILDLPNVYFQPNSTVLRQSSYRELDKLVEFLSSNNFKVRVNGHTQGNKRIVNNSPSLSPEMKFKGSALRLSKKRADRVLNYLVEKGIDKKRISTRGFAGRKPKIKHPKSRSEREMNMRVEVEILK